MEQKTDVRDPDEKVVEIEMERLRAFDKPENEAFPKMIELFCRSDFEVREMVGITPIHIDDTVSSLSAILLDDDYYHVLLEGKSNANGLSVLRPEYLILFKAKEYLDLKQRKENGENVDSKNGTISLEEKQVPWLMLSLTVLHMTAIRSTSQALMLSTIDPCGRYMDWINQFGNSISLIVAHSVWTGGSRHTGRAALPHKNIQILMVTVLFLYFILLWIY